MGPCLQIDLMRLPTASAELPEMYFARTRWPVTFYAIAISVFPGLSWWQLLIFEPLILCT